MWQEKNGQEDEKIQLQILILKVKSINTLKLPETHRLHNNLITGVWMVGQDASVKNTMTVKLHKLWLSVFWAANK